MPRPSEFLERMTVVRAAGESLEALFHRGRGAQPVVLAPGHPRLYGTMESAVLAEVTWALTRRGHPTLRFNWRGVGASTGETSVPDLFQHSGDEPIDAALLDDSYADLSAAIDQQLETTGERELAVVGYSFGAAVAARAAADHPAVARVVLVAPPVGRLPFDFDAVSATGIPAYVVCGAEDEVASPDRVEAALGGSLAVHRIPKARHEFSRGLGPLGTFVSGAFPQHDEPLY